MPLESFDYIADLDQSNPTATDPKSQGDDHLRGIKKALVQTLPNLDAPVTVTPAEMNRLGGVTSSVQAQLNTLATDKYDKAGGTVTGEINVEPASGDALVSLSRAAGSNRRARGRTGALLRWTLDLGNSTTEAGGNAGSDFALSRFNDAGSLLEVAMLISRATGAVTIPKPVALGSTLTVAGGGTFTGEFTFATEVHVPAPTEPTHATNQQWVADAIAAASGGATQLFRDARTSNTPLNVPDVGKWIDITSGTFTQQFTAVATLGNGWWCYLSNSGTGDITLDPSGSELIDGLTSYVMYPGEFRLLQCDGTTIRTVVMQAFNKVFASSGTFYKPPGYSNFGGELWGAGGGGAAQVQTGTTLNARSGGAGGAGYPFTLLAASLASTEAVIIGAGGTAAVISGGSGGAGTSGGDGGNSSFAGMTNGGGKGGQNSATQTAGGVALNAAIFVGANNAATYANQYNGGAQSLTATALQSIWGGGGGGGFASSAIIAAGSSVFGGKGGEALVTAVTGQVGNSGVIPGGGGGLARLDAASGTITSGAGARGELRIRGII